jgi:hypothetical protein
MNSVLAISATVLVAACDNSTPTGPGDMAFLAHWKDDAGCEFYEHWNGTTCALDNPAISNDELSCWSHGQVNSLGVGLPCQPGVRECPTNLKANCCHVDDRRNGAICTMGCNTDADCGDNGWCSILGICLGAFCKPGFLDPNRPQPYSGDFPCNPATVPSSGLGKKCTLGGAECAGLKAIHCLGDPANLQPPQMDGGVPDGGVPTPTSFCTFECAVDSDCGAGASCVYLEAKPYFCAPNECVAQFQNEDFPQWDLPDPGFPVCATP